MVDFAAWDEFHDERYPFHGGENYCEAHIPYPPLCSDLLVTCDAMHTNRGVGDGLHTDSIGVYC